MLLIAVIAAETIKPGAVGAVYTLIILGLILAALADLLAITGQNNRNRQIRYQFPAEYVPLQKPDDDDE